MTNLNKQKNINSREKVVKTSQNKRMKFILYATAWLIIVISSALTISATQKSKNYIIKKDGVVLTVNKIQYDQKGQFPFVPPENAKFAKVNITVKNNSKNIFAFAPVLQTHLVDENNNKYDLAVSILDNPIVAGDINPGQSVTGDISYLIPANSKEQTLNFDPKK